MSETATNVVKLTKPIRAHGKDVAELTFRDMTGEDLMNCGIPVVEVEDGHRIDFLALGKLIAALAGVPMASVREMAPKDMKLCLPVVMAFL